jgi:hypothetical protein
MTGKHERAALDRLRVAGSLRLAVTPAADAEADLLMAGDVLDGLRAAAALLMAAEEIEAAAKACGERLRAALAEVMSDTGATSLDLPHHRLSLVDGKTAATVTDPAALPAEYMVQPPPRPDLHAIAKALKHGPVPGAALRNGASHIKISPRQEKTR